MYESSARKLSGCASNLLAHEDLGQFEEAHHWNIQAKFYNEKFPLVYESDNIGDSIMKIMVLHSNKMRECCLRTLVDRKRKRYDNAVDVTTKKDTSVTFWVERKKFLSYI